MYFYMHVLMKQGRNVHRYIVRGEKYRDRQRESERGSEREKESERGSEREKESERQRQR